MGKRSRAVTSVLLGLAGGAALAAFLASKTGKILKEKLTDKAKEYQDRPEDLHADLVQKAQDLSQKATDKVTEVKSQLESGEFNLDEWLKASQNQIQQIKEQSLQRIQQVKERLADSEVSSDAFFTRGVTPTSQDLKDVTPAEVIQESFEDIELDFSDLSDAVFVEKSDERN